MVLKGSLFEIICPKDTQKNGFYWMVVGLIYGSIGTLHLFSSREKIRFGWI
jgi:hypothetical protein